MRHRRRERQTRVGFQAEPHGGWLHPDSMGATGCICSHLTRGLGFHNVYSKSLMGKSHPEALAASWEDW